MRVVPLRLLTLALLALTAVPAAASARTLEPVIAADGRLTFADGDRTSMRATRTRTVTVEASLATLRRPFTPRRVTADGRRVRFTYDRRAGVLRVGGLRGRAITLRVSAR